jgi:hypothetical protein
MLLYKCMREGIIVFLFQLELSFFGGCAREG